MRDRRAFSLIEVTLALALFSFGAVALLSLLSVGFRQEQAAVHETRAGHLAATLFTTLRQPPFQAVDCYGTTLNLTQPHGGTTPLLLHATFADGQPPAISDTASAAALYTLELKCEPIAAPANRVAATQITALIYPTGRPTEATLFQTIIGNL